MQEHIEKVKNHKFIKILEESLETTNAILEDLNDINQSDLRVIKRALHVLTHIEGIYHNTDPLMINPKKLTLYIDKNTNPKYIQLPTLLSNYKENKQSNNIENITILLNSIVSFSSYFLYPKTGREMAGLRKATEKYHSSVEAFIKDTQEKIKMFTNNYEEMSATVSNEIEEHNDSISSFEETLLNEQKDLKATFDNHAKELQEEYGEKYGEAENILKDFIDNSEHELSDLKEAYQSTIDKHIEEAQGIIGALAERSISYGFQKIANQEKKSKQNWNKLTIGSFIGLIVYTLVMVFASFYIEFTWSTLILRGLTGVGVFGALIGFCSKQAGNHEKVERDNRKKELELASLNPYFAEFEKADLFEVKKEMASRFFGHDESSIKKEEDE